MKSYDEAVKAYHDAYKDGRREGYEEGLKAGLGVNRAAARDQDPYPGPWQAGYDAGYEQGKKGYLKPPKGPTWLGAVVSMWCGAGVGLLVIGAGACVFAALKYLT